MSLIVLLLEISPFCAIIYLYLSWNQWKTSRTPKVSKKNSLFNSLAVQYCSDFLMRPYRPTFWAFLPLIHTVFSARWPRKHSAMDIEYLEVSESAIVGIIWPQAQCQDTVNIVLTEQSPIVVFITNPLVTDNCFQPYVEIAQRNGFRPALFLCHDAVRLPKTQQPFHNSPDINYNLRNKDEFDFGEALDYIRYKYSSSLVYVVSLSYGSATLFKFLTTDPKSRHVTGAASISPAWQTEPNRFPVSNKHATLNGVVVSDNDLVVPQSYKSVFRKFTQLRYFSCQEDENLRQSAVMSNEIFGRFNRLITPTIVLYSKDDPILSTEDRSRLAGMWKNSDLLLVVETSVGGHVGFLQGFTPQSWAANLVFQYFDAVGKFRDATVAKVLNQQKFFP